MKKKTLALLLALIMLISALAGCGASKPGDDPAQTNPAQTSDTTPDTGGSNELEPAIDEIVVGTTSVIETAVRDEYNYDMLASGVSEIPLVYQDVSGTYHPLMASYETEDAITWTYTIAEGMKWSDGEPVTAEDILFTLQYADAGGSANFVDQTNDDGETTTAKYTAYELSEDRMSISLTLASPNVRELSNMTSFRVMPEHIYKDNDNPTDADKRVGCGPYVFESFNKEAGTISFVVDPNYPVAPNVARITYQLFGNEDTMYAALQNGDIDMVWSYSGGVSATYQDVLAENADITLENVPAANVPTVLAFNNAEGLFADENIRKAVSYALDYEIFKSYVGSVYAQTPNAGFVPNTTVGYIETEELTTDTDKAQQYMADAGYSEKNSDGFYVNAEGEAASFTLTYRADKTNQVSSAELIKTQLEAFGIEVILEPLDSDSYNAKTSNKFSENNITMEAALYGYTSAGMGMGNGLATIYVDGEHAVQGGCQVYDPEFQEIRDEMSAAANLDEYYKAAAKMQQYYAEHVPLLALYWDNLMYAYSSSYENITIDFVFGLNNVNNWFTITAK